MCGIVGYIGTQNAAEILLNGLQELEYRGYDSAGVAFLENNKLQSFKSVGKLTELKKTVGNFKNNCFCIGIGHTRWATHGKPTLLNAHPHLENSKSAVVHNGIIENYKELKQFLQNRDIVFQSQTDTEVIVKLFEYEYSQSQTSDEAFKKTIAQIEGSYAILLCTTDKNDGIFYAKQNSPLLIARGKDGLFFASCASAVAAKAQEIHYLQDGDFGFLNQTTAEHLSDFEPLSLDIESAQKDGFDFFMEKEIYEQHKILFDTVAGRLGDGNIIFDELPCNIFESIDEIRICACGTSYHSAMVASYLFERLARIRCTVEIASEFRYKNPILKKNELFVVVTQSGETADTLEALKMVKKEGLKTFAICNVNGSSIVREADTSVLCRAGIEKGVASTKTFSSQVTVFWMLALYLARQRDMLDMTQINNEIKAIKKAIKATTVCPQTHQTIHRLSKRYLHGHGFFYIGRDVFYPLGLEGALKLKEITYLHAEGYPAGEMKHGPIALADSNLFVVALMPKNALYDKNRSNILELASRDATICAISSKLSFEADDWIKTSSYENEMVEFFEMTVILQLLALEVCKRLNLNADMPRNLAKSVTVE